MQNFKSHQYRVLWSQFLKSVRDFFYQKDFIECSTPVLVPCPGTEPAIDFFQMESLFLRSSPELHLKKILASGEKRIFEIGPVFRKNEWTPHHRPQFTMLEWYRAFFDLDQIYGKQMLFIILSVFLITILLSLEAKFYERFASVIYIFSLIKILPYFVMEILKDYYGLSGLFIACIYSAALRF